MTSLYMSYSKTIQSALYDVLKQYIETQIKRTETKIKKKPEVNRSLFAKKLNYRGGQSIL